MNRARIREILLANGFRVPEGADDLRPYVYEAVEAVLRETAAPEGWQMVPVEPTLEMSEAGAYSTGDNVKGRPVWKASIDEQAAHVYRAMLAAAPTPPVAAPTCRDDGRCQYAIDSGAEGDGRCPPGKCVMPQVAAEATSAEREPIALRLPEPMTDAEMMRALGNMTGLDLYDVWRRAEAETLRRVKEATK